MNWRSFFQPKNLIFIVAILFFVYRGVVLLDPDFGWDITIGRTILEKGIPRVDPFSYTMVSFPSVDHEWLTSVFLALTYPLLGQIGLTVFYTSVALGALLLSLSNPISRKYTLKQAGQLLFRPFVFVLGAGTIFTFFGIRPQVESWFILSLFLWLTLNEDIWEKFYWLTPFLFILWVNLHGSFAVGIASLLIISILKWVRLKRIKVRELITFSLCFLATFINPYGLRIWWEVWLSVSDASLRWTIAEWQPAITLPNFVFLTVATLSVFLITKYRQKFRLEELGLNLFFLLQGVGSVRHIPLWVVVDLPMLVVALDCLYQEVSKIEFGPERFKKFIQYALWGSFGLFVIEAALQTFTSVAYLNERYFYPKKAVEFLKTDLPKGQIFSEYGWGGYLIWKLPEKKVFIDGRMPSWRWQANIPGESNYVMKDYAKLLAGEINYQEVFAKYDVKSVLWPKPQAVGIIEKLGNRIANFLTKFGYKSKNTPFNLLKKLEEDGWVKTYEDSVAVVYEKS